MERQNLPSTLDRSQQDLLGLAFRESLIVESDLGDAKHGDQKTNNRAEQDRPLLVLTNLRKQVNTIADSRITGDDIGYATVNPASNGRARDLQFGEEVSISRLADCFLNPVVVGPPRVRRLHLRCIGRRVPEGGPSRKCPALLGRCDCNALSAECHGT